MENWITGVNDDGIVISSRIRLARNIKGEAFPYRLDEEESRKIINDVEKAFYPEQSSEFKTINLWEQDKMTQQTFLEKHLISHKLLSNSKNAAFIVNKDETISIMVNEEDHIRLQCITAGFNLKEAYEAADKLDDKLEESLQYAFHEKLGYLTACPTNVGTGLRASLMIHLPALSMNSEMNGVLKALTQVGMTIRGLYGEGSEALGDFYQISNQITLGLREEEIITNLTAVANQIINQENIAREQMLKKYKYELEDKLLRSLGLLRSAVLLNSKECLFNLSNVRLGVDLGIINGIDKKTLNNLLVDIQPASLQSKSNEKLSEKERDLKRAEMVREILK